MNATLKVHLAEWTDWDFAAYRLGSCLGIEAPKNVFWSNHPLGEMLFSMLDLLVKRGVLERREEPDIQFRWSPTFRGDWEQRQSS